MQEIVKASPKYAEKEDVRSKVQAIVQHAVSGGSVTSQAELNELFATFDMSLRALRGVPYEVWTKLPTKKV